MKVENGSAGKKPTVTFPIKDKNGNPIAANQMRVWHEPGRADHRLHRFPERLHLRQPGHQVAGVSGANGVYTYTFANADPGRRQGQLRDPDRRPPRA